MEAVLGKIRLVITPTYLQSELTSNLDDYGKKGGITLGLTGAQVPFPHIFAQPIAMAWKISLPSFLLSLISRHS